jgi:phosphoglycolate phosphatase-like HAD superfamily hydrolase
MTAVSICTIYIDLDGPILDVSERYYKVHRKISNEFGISNNLTKKQYWSLKRSDAPLFKINKKITGRLAVRYRKKWLYYIEHKKFLIYDKVWPHAEICLKKMSANLNLYLITARMKKKNLMWELKRNKLLQYFKKVYIANPLGGIHAKEKLLKRYRYLNHKNSLIIGDTEVDILCGKKYDMVTVAVSNGIRNKTKLVLLNPDICVNNVKDFLNGYNGIA